MKFRESMCKENKDSSKIWKKQQTYVQKYEVLKAYKETIDQVRKFTFDQYKRFLIVMFYSISISYYLPYFIHSYVLS